MLSISARLRPMRSAIKPNSTPPMPEARSVSVARKPEVALLIPRSRMMWVSTSAYSMASNASSIQPSEAARSVRRWSTVVCEKVATAVAGIREIVEVRNQRGKDKLHRKRRTEKLRCECA